MKEEIIKNKKRFRKSLIFVLFVLTCFFIYFTGCKTTPKLKHENVIEEGENQLPNYILETELNFKDIPDPSKYVFIRLYDSDYINPFYPANLLKFGVEKTEVTDTIASHAAIGFSLEDKFYGLTSGGDHQLAIETCTDTKSNKFLKNCDPEKSVQYTYAIKVTEQEYEALKKFVEGYAEGTDIKYDVWKNFEMATFSTKRKFFTNEENQQFGTVEYPKKRDNYKTKIDNWETHFVCSTFVAYALVVNVMPVRQWFLENEIDYRFVNVTDLVEIPGVVRLFASTFNEYNNAAQAFASENPQFKQYLNN